MAQQRIRTKEIRVTLGYKYDSQLCRQFHSITGIGLKRFRLSALNAEAVVRRAFKGVA